MQFTINSFSSDELQRRRHDLIEELVSAEYAATGGAPLSMQDIHDLASLGLLSVNERKAYDELRRVELLLGE
ncbi:hypothetical protein [Corynebacterium cystitidis]|uniref:Uncharacterized protein n=1 Tax=Corynebacterium cystitidis DSM 20524 TaxID=1121357 RepID=A0A1H9UVG0_9CORY|nr:hypothetical protein [Corynebacterium cystitidis]WJY83692.1 hypothetical protein CCYS_14055 [Corynebacterium cystitidis DSM 20524]SES13331.1 hypothetical protein SAMN05661109_01944 [Corynebacterium cystitidis DSM 20524]SNV91280.1 Uncharacterised protein [Corynebacterium cystitidis]